MVRLSNRDAILALMQVPGIGSTLYSRLVSRFGSPVEVWECSGSALDSVRFLPAKARKCLLDGPDLESLDLLKKRLDAMGAWTLTLDHPDYPSRLRQIPQAPPVLFGLGDMHVLGQKSLAVVGSRKASSYGRRVAHELAQGLSEKGYLIVSGLAMGIDTAAHKGAVASGGLTVAVKGCGLDVEYPARNQALAREICQNGAVVTEFFPGVPPEPGNFPSRNRIISGLSRAVLVVEAGPGSGSLITAYLGLEQGKDVMAVPGSIYSYNSRGCHRLIREGAALVTSVEQVLEVLGEDFTEKGLAQSGKTVKVSSLSPDEKTVVDNLQAEPQHIDDISAQCKMPASTVCSVLLRLELKGLVLNHSGGKYSIKNVI